jgi:hypothetical protein
LQTQLEFWQRYLFVDFCFYKIGPFMKSILINKHQYFITYDNHFHDHLYGITKQIAHKIETSYAKMQTNPRQAIKLLERLVAKYPDVPHFKNFLTAAYFDCGENKLAYVVNNLIIKNHPDYLFGKINKALEYINEGEFRQAKKALGKHLELPDIYPNRETFHIVEFLAYYKAVILYFCHVKNFKKAEQTLDTMLKVDPYHIITDQAREIIIKHKYAKADYKYDNDEYPNLTPRSYDKSLQTENEPNFNFIEMRLLYENSLEIDPTNLKSILALPKEDLISDLETVLSDSIRRYEYYKNIVEKNGWDEDLFTFPFHAMYLLAELKSEKSLSIVLQFLRQGDELLVFWLGDSLTEDVWEIIYKLGQNRLNDLKSFFFEKNQYPYAFAPILSAMGQIVHHHPDRRQEILDWYESIFKYYLEHLDDEELIDADTIGLLIGDCIAIGPIELLPYIKEIYKNEVVDPGICGDFQEVKTDIENPWYQVKEIKNIYDRYDHLIEKWYKQNAKLDGKIHKPDILNDVPVDTIKPVSTGPKIGRNDPCICGSGKKYKKCCIEKDTNEKE